VITVGPDQTRELRVLLTVPADTKLGRSTPVSFRITDTISRETATAADHFIAE